MCQSDATPHHPVHRDEPACRGCPGDAARREFFDEIAGGWDVRVVTDAFKARLRAAIESLGIAVDETVLDLGCGTGNLTRLLAERLGPGSSIIAADFSQGMLDVARGKLPDDPRIRWSCAHADSLPVESASVDRAICFSAWPHFAQPEQVATELWRVLRPGGLFHVLHVDGRETINRIHAHAGPAVAHDLLPPAVKLAMLLGGVGFEPLVMVDEADYYLVTVARPTEA